MAARVVSAIRDIGSQLVRRRFQKSADLMPDDYASLVDHFEATGNIARAPWVAWFSDFIDPSGRLGENAPFPA